MYFLKLDFTPCKAEQPLQGMELQEKKRVVWKGYRIQLYFTKYCLLHVRMIVFEHINNVKFKACL